MGDQVKIGEAALGICFPLKAHSSYPMHPVPHLSFSIDSEKTESVYSLEKTLHATKK